jgi:parallel beta-helix repeat protein
MKAVTLVLISALVFFSLHTAVLANTCTDIKGSAGFITGSATADFSNVTVSQAKNMIDSNTSLVILDVRNQSEYDTGHIRNARLIPVYELEGRLDELSKTDDILVYCKSGFRSSTASRILVDNSFMYVYNMIGGITAWISAGYPVYVNYSSVQEAINGAADGQTIFVSSGTYYEHLIVNESLSLVGENIETSIIDGTSNGTIFDVTASNVSISSFTVQNSGCPCAGRSGVYVEIGCQNVNLTANFMTGNGFGIKLNGVHNVTAARNNMSGNSYGIRLENSSSNIIDENNIMNSYSYGIYLDSSSGNFFYHNNLVKNNPAMPQVYSSNSSNIWDDGYPSGGNYWSDYAGVDLFSGPYQNVTGSDGIGDTPYTIDENNTDRYPLMHPYFPLFGDVNGDGKVDMKDVGVVARAFGSHPDGSRWNPLADVDGNNAIDLRDIALVAKNFGKHYP